MAFHEFEKRCVIYDNSKYILTIKTISFIMKENN